MKEIKSLKYPAILKQVRLYGGGGTIKLLPKLREYNQKYGYKPGDKGYRSSESIKAQAMIESGSSKDKEAFLRDPLQVNNQGDYSTDNKKLKVAGLTQGEQMDPKKVQRLLLNGGGIKEHYMIRVALKLAGKAIEPRITEINF